MSRPPEGWEAEVFTYKPATEWDEHWVAADVVEARRLANELLDAFAGLPGLLTPL